MKTVRRRRKEGEKRVKLTSEINERLVMGEKEGEIKKKREKKTTASG